MIDTLLEKIRVDKNGIIVLEYPTIHYSQGFMPISDNLGTMSLSDFMEIIQEIPDTDLSFDMLEDGKIVIIIGKRRKTIDECKILALMLKNPYDGSYDNLISNIIGIQFHYESIVVIDESFVPNEKEFSSNKEKNGQRLKTVLIIDDNPDVLDLFVELMETKNFQVVGTGSNGEEAVGQYEKLQPDITLLDVVMPDTDGLYALDHIRKMNSDAAVIMITTDLSQDTAKRLEDLRATAVVYKPFDINDLVKIIHDIESGVMVQFKKLRNNASYI